jgi:hypothetical protein
MERIHRLGSQATVERSIGEMGRKIQSKKAPFANLTNLIYEKELIKIFFIILSWTSIINQNQTWWQTFGQSSNTGLTKSTII